MKRVSPSLATLRRALTDARHGGKFFSSDEIEGLIAELRSIQDAAVALEDAVANARRQTPRAEPPPPAAMPIGTFYFQPAARQ